MLWTNDNYRNQKDYRKDAIINLSTKKKNVFLLFNASLKIQPFQNKSKLKETSEDTRNSKSRKKVKKEDINNYKQFVAELLAEVRNSLLT